MGNTPHSTTLRPKEEEGVGNPAVMAETLHATVSETAMIAKDVSDNMKTAALTIAVYSKKIAHYEIMIGNAGLQGLLAVGVCLSCRTMFLSKDMRDCQCGLALVCEECYEQ